MALILRNCRHDGSSKHGFVWDTDIGAVNVALDWIKNEECGNGLHGWLNGIGNSSVSDYNNSNLWLVLEVDKFVDLWDKVKFQSCIVKFKGTKSECSKYLYDNGVRGKIIGLSGEFAEAGDLSNLFGSDNSTLTAGYKSNLTAGDYSTLTAGDKSNLTAGDYSTLTAGDKSTLTAGYKSNLTAGDESTLKAGDESTLTAGDYSTLTAGYNSTLTAGDYSTLTAGGYSTLKAGYNSTLKAGDNSTLKTGNESTLTAGVGSVIITRWYDNNKRNVATFIISESQANKTFLYSDGKQIKIL